MYKKFAQAIIFFAIFWAALHKTAFAQPSIENPIAAKSFMDILDAIIGYAVLVVTPISVLVILYAALLFMTSAGDVEKVKKAKKALLWALVGLAIVLTGRGFIFIIQDVLRGGGGAPSGIFCEQNPTLPECYGP